MDSVFELRRYRLKPGCREELIDLFEDQFLLSQKKCGINVIAQFRDLDHEDCFTWIRGFPDMEARALSLGEFYNGPVWAAHGAAANKTMVNSDNVLQLKPMPGHVPFAADKGGREGPYSGIVEATIYNLAPGTEQAFADFHMRSVAPVLGRAGGRLDAVFLTEKSPNSFARLPVREGESVVVTLMAYQDASACARAAGILAGNKHWTVRVEPELQQLLWRKPERFRLCPTNRSRYRATF